MSRSPKAFADMHREALAEIRQPEITASQARAAFQKRVDATWGLISRGSNSMPYVLAMLQSNDPDAREDAAGILAEIGKSPEAVEELLHSLEIEADVTARDSIVMALGSLKNRLAIPALARFIRDEAADGDTRHTAVESLGKIVRKRFLASSQPIKEAISWLKKHEL